MTKRRVKKMKEISEKKMQKLIKRDRRRKRAQKMGAATGILAAAFTAGLLYGDKILKKVDNVSKKVDVVRGNVFDAFEDATDVDKEDAIEILEDAEDDAFEFIDRVADRVTDFFEAIGGALEDDD